MPPIVTDKALRQLVAELATTTPEDMAAVLGMLDARSGAQVRALLAAYAGVEELPEVEPEVTGVNTSGLSDWLAARTLGRPLGSGDAYQITPHTLDVLRHFAAAMPRQHRPAPGASQRPATKGRESFGLLLSPFGRNGAGA